MQTVYIETSIVSFLRQNPAAASESVRRQLATLDWWEQHRHRFELVTSQYVVDEANMGNIAFASERLKRLAGIPLLPLSDEITSLPPRSFRVQYCLRTRIVDALHIACAAFNRVDYLSTWNCKHYRQSDDATSRFSHIGRLRSPFSNHLYAEGHGR